MTVPREGESIYGIGRTSNRKAGADYKIDHETGCWNWLKAVMQNGYPSGRPYRTYYELANGPVPAGHDVHHVCKNRLCVNPDHLEALHRRMHDVEHFLGERAGGITLEDVRAMRELGRQPGVTAAAVAAQYGIHEITVYNYWNNTAWADMFDDGPCRPVGRICAHCGGPVAPEKMRDARYCTPKCQHAFNRNKPEQKAKRAERQRRRREQQRKAA